MILCISVGSVVTLPLFFWFCLGSSLFFFHESDYHSNKTTAYRDKINFRKRLIYCNNLVLNESGRSTGREKEERGSIINMCFLHYAITPNPLRHISWSFFHYGYRNLLKCMLSSNSTLIKYVLIWGLLFNFIINLISITLLLPLVVLNLSGDKMDELLP